MILTKEQAREVYSGTQLSGKAVRTITCVWNGKDGDPIIARYESGVDTIHVYGEFILVGWEQYDRDKERYDSPEDFKKAYNL